VFAKVDHVIHKTLTAIESGHSVVIGLQTTGESSMHKSLEKHGAVNPNPTAL